MICDKCKHKDYCAFKCTECGQSKPICPEDKDCCFTPLSDEDIVKTQMEFVAWLKAEGIYNQFESAATMRAMQQVWERAKRIRK